MAEQQQDVDALKRRGRRRLVGAVALVLLAVIVLPMVLDPEPRRAVPPVSVRIPGENDTAFTPKPAGKPPVAPMERKQEEKSSAEEKKPPEQRVAEKKQPPPDRARVEAPIAGTEFVVPVGAYANPKGIVAKLAAARIPYFTEAAPGNLTRVRAGPFQTKEAADKAFDRLKALGLKPGPVASKSG